MARFRKQVKKTIFICVEGQDEFVFIRHLNNLYNNRNTHPTIKDAAGGDPSEIVEYCLRATKNREYSARIILMDRDRLWTQDTIKQIEQNGLIVIGSSPCFEAFLLEILDLRHTFDANEAHKCKTSFRKTCLPTNKKGIDIHDCKKLFPKTLLEKKRKKQLMLNQLINLLAGNF